jgi:glycosyltransferase involved in cell wall biosynthesis
MAIIVGIVYDVDENWIAGSYYIENLILALKITSGEKLHIKVYSKDRTQFEGLSKRTRYPYLSWVPLIDKNTIFDKIVNKITVLLFKRHFIIRGLDNEVDVLFPASDTYFFDNIRNKLFWIPDFQEAHLPRFFTTEEITKRKDFQKKIVKKECPVLVSSKNAMSDFQAQYPAAKNRLFVLPFAVTLPDLSGIDFEPLTKKFNIDREFFICSNQLWAHKNHKVVLKALIELRKQGSQPLVVFTGKPYDARNPRYYEELIQFVNENQLTSNTLFLGFIDRSEQLVLMRNSLAVIQPSLFEGWSTVIEDAKALGKLVVASDIPVHKEQLGDHYKFYFDKDSSEELARKLSLVTRGEKSTSSDAYREAILTFGDSFQKIIRQII